MKFSHWKYIYWILLAVALFLMVRLSLDAGISGDELVHKEQAVKVMDYFYSGGSDKGALHTPKTNLKYYGQSFDNLMELVSRVFQIDDIMTLRHVGNAAAGWLIILFASLIALLLSGYHAAAITVLALVFAPRFLGHSFNNLKDIPFALGSTAFAYYLIRYIKEFTQVKGSVIVGLIASIAFTLSIRAGGLILFGYFGLAVGVMLLLHPSELKKQAVNVGLVVLGGYFAGLLLWPYGLINPIVNPLKSLVVMSDYPVTIRQVFEGKVYWSDQLPWYYLIKYISITTPIAVLLGVLLFVLSSLLRKVKNIDRVILGMLSFMIVFPLLFVIAKHSNVYGGWRHMLFVYPLIAVLCGIGWSRLMSNWARELIVSIALIGLLLNPISFTARSHPYQYLYFNQFVGGWENAYGNYEGDYYFHSVSAACDWIKEKNKTKKITVASNFWIGWDFRDNSNITTKYVSYYERGKEDWDYAIIGNSYIQPSQLKNKVWPPSNTVHTIEVDKHPICIVLKRTTREDIKGYRDAKDGQYSKAIAHFERAVKADPGNANVWLTLGKCYKEKGITDRAKMCFNQSVNIYPNYEPALVQLAKLEFEADRSMYAIDLLQQVIEQNSKYLRAYVELAHIYIQLGQMHEASYWLLKCNEVHPGYEPAKELQQQIFSESRKNYNIRKISNIHQTKIIQS
ncbi:tetratricopeptide repeat protein [Prolixibacteraceae bacterium JC049]|nr:tetratricopeptide repeat protein [Prolixibacteraceae bacterium JC049]